MTDSATHGRIRKLLTIHLVMQILFVALLVFMAFQFQQTFMKKGIGHVFTNSLIATFVLQLALFYPIYKLAAAEARREVTTAQTSDLAVLKELRRQRIFGDVIKTSIFFFYAIFMVLAPPATFVMSTAFFSFVATIITYLQCFNHAARQQLRQP